MVTKKSAKKSANKSRAKNASRTSVDVSHENGKLVAILSYIVIGLIWYALDKEVRKDSFARFHFKQGVVLFITVVLLNIIAGILSNLVGFWIYTVTNVIDLLLVVLGIVAAINGEKKQLPVIGQYAEKI